MSLAASQGVLQRLYLDGLLSYPRAEARALSEEGVSVVGRLARAVGVPFDGSRVARFVRDGAPGAHESPRPSALGVEAFAEAAHAPAWACDGPTRTMGAIARRLLRAVSPIVIERPDVAALPEWARALHWARPGPGTCPVLVEDASGSPAFRRFSMEEVALRALVGARLGRPSTLVGHARRVAERGWLGPDGRLSERGLCALNRVPGWLATPEVSRSVERAFRAGPGDGGTSREANPPEGGAWQAGFGARVDRALEALGPRGAGALRRRVAGVAPQEGPGFGLGPRGLGVNSMAGVRASGHASLPASPGSPGSVPVL